MSRPHDRHARAGFFVMVATGERRRQVRPEQRRALIVAAAADDFGRRGHRDARLEDIAQAATGTIDGLAVLAVEGRTPEQLTDLAMALLWPGLAAMSEE